MSAVGHLRLVREDDAQTIPAIEACAGCLFDAIDGLAGQQTVPLARLRCYIRKGHHLAARHRQPLFAHVSD